MQNQYEKATSLDGIVKEDYFMEANRHSQRLPQPSINSTNVIQYRFTEHQSPDYIESGGLYKCLFCEFRSPIKAHLDSHAITHKVVRFNCNFCWKFFNVVEDLMAHMSQEHPPNADRRKRKADTEASAESFNEAKRQATDDTAEVEASPCPHCKGIFLEKDLLKKHMEELHKEFLDNSSSTSYFNSFQLFLTQRAISSYDSYFPPKHRKRFTVPWK
ncbi:zinc finger protein 521-like isoform X2 [Phlebotomus papatasi]|uniref:zinc finger protein 521-like isoform X2 n=1 Tax=Phlebotomus papatasi TaxID=29031 RepID=UPI0024838CA7|nr:zinc finger protein 521-like isoform X2 [Phlebotomus papatasi]